MSTFVKIPVMVVDRALTELGVSEPEVTFAYVDIDKIVMIRDDEGQTRPESAIHLINGDTFQVPLHIEKLKAALSKHIKFI